MSSPSSDHAAGASGEGRGYYGWVIAGTLMLLVMVLWGTYYAFGVFLKPLAEEFGWTRATTSGPYGLSMAIQGIAGVGAGFFCDRYGPRAVTFFACMATAVGYVLLSQMHSLWEFYLAMMVLVAIGTTTSYVVPVATIPRWFVHRRGLALGLALAGMGIGDVVFPRVMTSVIAGPGWRVAYLVLAGVVAAVALLCVAVLRPAPRQRPQPLPQTGSKIVLAEKPALSLGQSLRLPHFWGLFVIWMLVGIPLLIIRTHIVPDATDAGMSEAAAAFVLTALGVSVTASRIGVGRISDWLGNKYTYFVCLALQLVALFALVGGSGAWLFYVVAVLFGAGYAGASIVYPKIVADIFGVASIGTLIGLLGVGWYVGAALAPPLAGWIYDQTSSYSWAFILGGIVMGLALLLANVVLRGYARPVAAPAPVDTQEAV